MYTIFYYYNIAFFVVLRYDSGMGRPKKASIPRRFVTTRMEPALYAKIKKLAIDLNKDVYLIIEEALRDYLKKKSKE